MADKTEKPVEKIIQQAAEAIILQEGDNVVKRRIKKSYRIKAIDDKLRKSRTRAEAKLLEKAGKIIPVPKVLKVDERNREITMEFINGKKLSEHLDSFQLEHAKQICSTIGKQIAELHNNGIIHGDLTTSNMIEKDSKIFFIDFGLGFHSQRREDKAVDLHLIKQALEAKHFKHFEAYFREVLHGYQAAKDHEQILAQLEKVEARGRYKH